MVKDPAQRGFMRRYGVGLELVCQILHCFMQCLVIVFLAEDEVEGKVGGKASSLVVAAGEATGQKARCKRPVCIEVHAMST